MKLAALLEARYYGPKWTMYEISGSRRIPNLPLVHESGVVLVGQSHSYKDVYWLFVAAQSDEQVDEFVSDHYWNYKHSNVDEDSIEVEYAPASEWDDFTDKKISDIIRGAK